MKRGLVAAADGSAQVYEQRLERLRVRLRQAGADVGLIYGDVYRSDDIAHLTNLCIYWNEGTIAVPVTDPPTPPAFLAKLSARVHTWMRRTSVLEDLRASQKLPQLIADYLAEVSASTVALVDRRWWPSELVDGIAAAAAGVTLIDLPGAVRADRAVPDAHGRADLEQAGVLVGRALAAVASAEDADTDRLAAIERVARGGGARDVLAAVRTTQTPTTPSTQVELTVQYGNVWAAAARVLPQSPEPLAAAWAAARAALAAGTTSAELARAVTGAGVTGAGVTGAGVTIVDHRDLATAGDYRPADDAGDALADGTVVRLAVTVDGLTVADTLAIDGDGAVPLTDAAVEVDA